jgi:alpha-amylase/alpha-mannosidase (GH57 family)
MLEGTMSASPKSGPATAPPQRYLCVHGHFYQPPRENPWLETVELQDSAAPYHDWNERITSECYAPNGASRIVNQQRQIIRIVNNYARMSFNFGPTLLSWLKDFAPRAYRMIQDADQASASLYSNHGSALAQVYNHIIMPLASERDARTQIRWGIADFEHRFGRKPEGMWLAETAVSRSILDLLAQERIKFTILAPHQAARVRKLNTADSSNKSVILSGARSAQPKDPDASETTTTAQPISTNPAPEPNPWTETTDSTIDTTRPYLVQLDHGRSIAVFFYDGPASRAIAFEGLLNDGETFARRLIADFKDDNPGSVPQLVHVATDGESYGHHHKHGEMALSYALNWIKDNNLARLTNYGEFLEKFPPQWEAEVADNTSWSCAHGIERWRSDCGCNSGGKPGWNQRWRAPLREALDLLRDRTAPLAEAVAKPLLKDLWAARDAYIHVILDRSSDNLDRFFAAHATRTLTPAERITVFELLELERHTQLMYTSCGWFFDDISGIETVQIIAYAGRVIQLAAKLFTDPDLFSGPDLSIRSAYELEADFLQLLAHAESNDPDVGNGAEVYRRFVNAGRLELESVGAHYAISSMFRSYPDSGNIFCFDVHRHSYDVMTSGRGRFAVGRATLSSSITEECEDICFAGLHLGDQNLSAAVKRFAPEDAEAWETFIANARNSIRHANLPELIRFIDGYFDSTLYSLTSLFADEQHRILQSILNQTLSEVEGSLIRIYNEHSTLLDFLGEANVAAPPALALTAGFAINASLRRALEAETYDSAEIAHLLRRADIDHVTLDSDLLSYTADKLMQRAMVQLEAAAEQQAPQNLSVLHETLAIAESLRTLPMEVNLWQAQNIWNDLLRRSDATYWSREWREGFRKVGIALNIAVDDLVIDSGVRAF